uniref:Uncharacterized protein n=1 Tax=Globodera pallida TaxID=36090 RepID=A0A183CIY5_GLOPA
MLFLSSFMCRVLWFLRRRKIF